MILNTLSIVLSTVATVIEHAKGYFFGHGIYHGLHCRLCDHTRPQPQVSTHHPVGSDMMITQTTSRKRALIIGWGGAPDSARMAVQDIGNLVRDELHWSTIVINPLSPNTPTPEAIEQGLRWLTKDIDSRDSLLVYFCGPSWPYNECTIHPTHNPQVQVQLLASLSRLLGTSTPMVFLMMDTLNLALNSLNYICDPSYTNQRIQVIGRHPGSIMCIASNYRDGHHLGVFTQNLVRLLRTRNLRVSIEQILIELSSSMGDIGALEARCNKLVRWDRVFFGITDSG
jgi:hypothetical protein